MMKRFLFIVLWAVPIMILLFSCTDDNPLDNDHPENAAQLQIKSVVVPDGIQNNGKGTIREFAPGDTIGLFLFDYQFGSPFLFATYKNYWWQLSEPVFLTNYPIRLFSFYPYKNNEHVYLPDKIIDVEHVTQTDYLYSNNLGNFISWEMPRAEIRMKHVLALIQFKFLRNGYPQDGSIQRISVQNEAGIKHMHSKGKLNLENGKLEPMQGYHEEAQTYPEALNFYNSFINEEDYPRIMVLPTKPVLNERDVLIEFVIDGRTYRHYVKKGTSWQAGMKYTYEVEMYPVNRAMKFGDNSEEISVKLIQITEHV